MIFQKIIGITSSMKKKKLEVGKAESTALISYNINVVFINKILKFKRISFSSLKLIDNKFIKEKIQYLKM